MVLQALSDMVVSLPQSFATLRCNWDEKTSSTIWMLAIISAAGGVGDEGEDGEGAPRFLSSGGIILAPYGAAGD